MELNAQRLVQKIRQNADRLARIDRQLSRAPQAAAQTVRMGGRGFGQYLASRQQLAVKAQRRGSRGKLLQHVPFVVVMRQMQ